MTASSAQRLHAVAEAFLRPRTLPARNVVIAASDRSFSTTLLGRNLFDAAQRLGVGCELWTPDDEIHRQPAGEGVLHVRVLVFGALPSGSVRRLHAPVSGHGPDLFLFALRARAPQRLRDLYTLSMWCWSLAARRTRCLLPHATPESMLKLRQQWAREQSLPEAEFLGWPEAEGDRLRLSQQLLQSLLAAP